MGLFGSNDYLPHQPSSGGASIGGTVTGATQGSVLFAGAGGVLAQDNANFFYDDTDNQLVLGAGAVGKPALIFGDDTTGLWRPSLDALAASIAGALALTLGTATVPDADQTFGVGRVLMDSRVTDIAYWSHRDMSTSSNYALFQNASGSVRLNAASGQSVKINNNNGAAKIEVNTTGIGFFATTPAAQQAITGSRGGNAALASLLTGLATLGLITDGTTA